MRDDLPFIGPIVKRDVQTQCTNWSAYGLRQIWQMVEHETGQQSWDQVAAWKRMQGLCEFQASRLRDAASKLEMYWPTGPSEAAQLFQAVVLALAKKLDDNAAAAGRNAAVLSDLTVGIGQTRQKISALMDDLRRKEAAHNEYRSQQLPWWPDSGLIDSQRADLDRQARQVMIDADKIPAAARVGFRIPPPIGDIATSWTPTVLPPEPSPTDPGAQWTPRVIGPTPPRFDPPDPPAGVATPRPERAAEDPVLTGGAPFDRDDQQSRGLREHVPPAPVQVNEPLSNRVFPPVFPPSRGAVGPDGTIRGPQATTPPDRTGAPRPTTIAHATAPGAARPSTTPGGMMAPMMPPSGGRTGTSSGAVGRFSNRRGRLSDPDDAWRVPAGLPSVIEPSPEPVRHDPGPGVIGIDR